MTAFVRLAGIVDRSPRNAAKRSGLPGCAGPASRAAWERSAAPKARVAVSTVRQSGLATTTPIGIPSARIASVRGEASEGGRSPLPSFLVRKAEDDLGVVVEDLVDVSGRQG